MKRSVCYLIPHNTQQQTDKQIFEKSLCHPRPCFVSCFEQNAIKLSPSAVKTSATFAGNYQIDVRTLLLFLLRSDFPETIHLKVHQ